MKPFIFRTTCVESFGPDIHDMVEQAKPVTRRTFLRHCETAQVEAQLGYERDRRHGLTMAQDPYVRYYRSRYQGKPCYFFVWSAIEYIFLKEILAP